MENYELQKQKTKQSYIYPKDFKSWADDRVSTGMYLFVHEDHRLR